MIGASITNLLFVPLSFTLVTLFLGAVYYATRRRPRKMKTGHARIYRCSVCTHVYVDTRDVPLSRCLRCGCLNEAVKR